MDEFIRRMQEQQKLMQRLVEGSLRYVRKQQQMRETVERMALPHKAWIAHIETMASCFEATRFTLPTIDFDRIGDLIAAADAQSNLVANLTDKLVFRHAELIESLGRYCQVKQFGGILAARRHR